jgi:hypothetical protein
LQETIHEKLGHPWEQFQKKEQPEKSTAKEEPKDESK